MIEVTYSVIWFALQELLKLGWSLGEIDALPQYRLLMRGCSARHINEIREICDTVIPSQHHAASWKKLAGLLLSGRSDKNDSNRYLCEILEELLGYKTELARFRATLDTIDFLTDQTPHLEVWQARLVRDLWPEIFSKNTDREVLFRAFLQAIVEGKIASDDYGLDLTGWVIETTQARQRVCPEVEAGLAVAINKQIDGLWKSHREVLLYFYKNLNRNKGLHTKRVLVKETAEKFCIKESTVRRYLTEARGCLIEFLGSSSCSAIMPFFMRVAELEEVLRVREEEERRARW